MSAHFHSHDDDIPRFEPWLGVMLSSFIPAVVGLYVHARFLGPLIVATVTLFLVSLWMLRRQTMRRAVEQQSSSDRRQSSPLESFGREAGRDGS
jgi:hypothetical protein